MELTSADSYDRRLDRPSRKARGVYYTPAFAIEHMLKGTLGELLTSCSSLDEALRITVCDPACGTGAFLSATLDYIVRWALQEGHCDTGFDRAELEARIRSACLYGSDIDGRALKIAARNLPGANLVRRDALRPGAFGKLKFDVVLGNPPYGAANCLGGESARHFMELAVSLVKPGGVHAFVVPKSFLHSSTWSHLLERFIPHVYEIVDCGKLWPEVKLEQVIYFYRPREASSGYVSSVRDGESFVALGSIDKSSITEFGFALNGVSPAELELGRKIRAAGSSFGEHILNKRGVALQPLLSARSQGGIPAFGGKQIRRFGLTQEPKGYLPVKLAAMASDGYAPGDCILAQNIVAHVQSPTPQLKIAATLCRSGSAPVLVLDTVNRLFNRGSFSSPFLLAVLNSKLVSWYVYRFVVGRAVRTIHLDAPVTSKIPLPRKPAPILVSQLERAANALGRRYDPAIDEEIDALVCKLFRLSTSEALFLEKGWRGPLGVRG